MLRKAVFTAAGAAALALLPLFAAPAGAQENVYSKPDDSWVELSGRIVSVAPNSFQFDYGEGLITVEMDDWDWYDEDSRLDHGDYVTVAGTIDDGLFEASRMEAESIYSQDRSTHYANPEGEEKAGNPFRSPSTVLVPGTAPTGSFVRLTGVVKAVDGRSFTLATGSKELTVDTSDMTYNPMDDVGHQQVKKGDRVEVSGELTKAFVEKRKLVADLVVSLRGEDAESS